MKRSRSTRNRPLRHAAGISTSTADDKAAVTVGQVKYFATKAWEHLQANGGAGFSLSYSPHAHDKDVATIGHLRAAAIPFYDRLDDLNYTGAPNINIFTGYPWSSSSSDAKAVATIGQLKYLFSFDLTLPDDWDNDGIRNEWDGDIDGDGIPNGLDNDIDGDGQLNGADADQDGDGTNNGSDETPQGPTPETHHEVTVTYSLSGEAGGRAGVYEISDPIVWEIRKSGTGTKTVRLERGKAYYAEISTSGAVSNGSITITVNGGPWITVDHQTGNFAVTVNAGVSQSKKLNLLPVEVKAHQDQNGPQGSAPKYNDSPSSGSATNLFSVWPNEEIILKVKMPPPFDQQANLPANLIKWDVPGHTIADNTLEAPMQWPLNIFNGAAKEITITISGSDFKVHVKVQGVGFLTEAEGAALVPHAAPVMLAHSFEAKNYTNTTYPIGPKRDAIRHAYWCSLSVSTFPVTGGDVPFISTGHEYDNRYNDKQQAFNSTMDLKSNAVGTSVNRQVNGLPDKAAIKQALEQLYTAGEMFIWEIPPGAASASQEDSEGILIKSDGTRIH